MDIPKPNFNSHSLPVEHDLQNDNSTVEKVKKRKLEETGLKVSSEKYKRGSLRNIHERTIVKTSQLFEEGSIEKKIVDLNIPQSNISGY